MDSFTLRYFAAFREAMGKDQQEYPLPDAVHSIAQLLTWMEHNVPGAGPIVLDRARVHVAVNNVLANLDTAISAGDVVDIFPPVSGG